MLVYVRGSLEHNSLLSSSSVACCIDRLCGTFFQLALAVVFLFTLETLVGSSLACMLNQLICTIIHGGKISFKKNS